MTDNEWLDSLRNRTHKLSNWIMGNMSDITVLKEQHLDLKRRIEDLERLEVVIHQFKAQSQVLRWVLGIATAVICGLLIKLL